MTFITSILTCFKKSFCLKGRASLSEYWNFFLMRFILFGITSFYNVLGEASLIGALLYILTIPAGISARIRRFHDASYSGWNFWWIIPDAIIVYIPICLLTPVLGYFVILLFAFVGSLIPFSKLIGPSDNFKNKYGDTPN